MVGGPGGRAVLWSLHLKGCNQRDSTLGRVLPCLAPYQPVLLPWQELKFIALKRPGEQVPTVGISLEKAFEL